MDLALGGFRGSFNYDALTGNLDLGCGASGHVWNTDSVFQGKACDLTVRHGSASWVTPLAARHGVSAACGSVQIAAAVIPETYAYNGETFGYEDELTLPPVHVTLVFEKELYALTENQLRSFITSGGIAIAMIRFEATPLTQSLMTLNDLDLSEKRLYPVVGLELSYGPRQGRMAAEG